MSSKKNSTEKVTAIIPAAGSGTRLQSVTGKPKQLTLLHGKPLLVHTLERFQECADIDGIVIASRKNDVDLIWESYVEPYNLTKIRDIVPGGLNRQESVWAGMQACNESTEIVVVHDAARIFAEPALISESIQIAREHGGCVVGIPATDTIKKVIGETIDATIDRSVLWYAQTPQTFQYPLLKKAFIEAMGKKFVGTDEAMLMEEAGFDVQMINGSKMNFKITTPEDLRMAEIILQQTVAS
ncbi:MAG: 2-C-methyl-D-erythritol 4-phosphate cytidylyltransferase [Candidatus Marinimicrobia bacterium]|nr:2-C-methyl-D-erythritol 4-phosphate cytidylyltransferase [Candidatus Neomarinimicrobiota bacterium]